MTTISIIVAMGKNRVIGSEGKLPWNLPSDMEHFMRTTMGHPIIMGRKTHESIGEALPGRTNIILSKRKDTYTPGCIVVNNTHAAILLARLSDGGEDENGEIFVIGGGEIFEEFLAMTNRLYVTEINGTFEGETRFPEIDPGEWVEVSRVSKGKDERNPFDHEFVVFERKSNE